MRCFTMEFVSEQRGLAISLVSSRNSFEAVITWS